MSEETLLLNCWENEMNINLDREVQDLKNEKLRLPV